MSALLRRMRPGIALAIVLGLLSACPGAGGQGRTKIASSEDSTAADYVPPPLPQGRVVLTDAFGGSHVVEVEVAANHASRTRGLMWRKELSPGKGMLFVFGDDQLQSFWMRNTLIYLDMLFIGSDRRIVGIVQNAEPQTLTPRGPTDRVCRYVLEVPGGWTDKLGIRTGSVVEIHLPPGLDVER